MQVYFHIWNDRRINGNTHLKSKLRYYFINFILANLKPTQ